MLTNRRVSPVVVRLVNCVARAGVKVGLHQDVVSVVDVVGVVQAVKPVSTVTGNVPVVELVCVPSEADAVSLVVGPVVVSVEVEGRILEQEAQIVRVVVPQVNVDVVEPVVVEFANVVDPVVVGNVVNDEPTVTLQAPAEVGECQVIHAGA